MTKKMIVGWAIMMVISMSITSSLAQTCTETLEALNDDCHGGDTIADMAICCTDYVAIAAADPDCLCTVLLGILYQDPTTDVEALFTKCPIPGSFSSLCLEP
ncbi:hypothetical protein RND81_13G050000 [Saponaria officinalis]|uniref:Bifunctional inhibitor/plant lipid transfer protein/seed storage helical domain-containing protein n=1 Tax=Saponaria officinalis TaxID=3572 RepID=A0AAW1H0K3_SAPOF